MFKNRNILNLIILIIGAIVALFLYFEYFLMNKYFNQNIENEQQMITRMYNLKVKNIQQSYHRRVQNLLTLPSIKKGIMTKDSALLKKVLIDKFKKIQKENKYIKTMLITDTNNIVILRAHKQKIFGDDLSNVRPIIKKVNETKKTLFGFEAGKMSIPYRVTVPIIYEGIHYGALDMGISVNYFINYINTISLNAQSTSLLNKDFLKNFIKTTKLNSIPIKKGFLAPDFNTYFEPFLDKVDLNKKVSQVKNDGKTYLINTTFKMMSFDSTPFGTILIANDITQDVKKEMQNIFIVLMFIVLVMLIIYLVLRYYDF